MQEPDLNTIIGAALREARLQNLRTQDEIGIALGVQRTTISHYESGRREITVKDFILLAQALGCSPALLFPPAYQPTLRDVVAPPIVTIVTLLQQHPDLVPNVFDMIEARLNYEEEA